jgi:uncharacterized membrane protein YqjE
MADAHMDDPPREEAPRGLFGSLRALFDNVLAILHSRAELFTTELEEEVTRLVGVLLWAFVAVLCAIVGATFVGVMILLIAPPAYRAWTAAGLALLFLALAAVGYRSIRRILRAKPRPFDASLRELEKDRAHLRGGR